MGKDTQDAECVTLRMSYNTVLPSIVIQVVYPISPRRAVKTDSQSLLSLIWPGPMLSSNGANRSLSSRVSSSTEIEMVPCTTTNIGQGVNIETGPNNGTYLVNTSQPMLAPIV